MKIRIAVGVAMGIIVLVAASLIRGSGAPLENTTDVVRNQALEQRVKTLEEELKQKEVTLSFQEKRLKEFEEQPTLAVSQPHQSLDSDNRLSDTESLKKSDGPLVALQESEHGDFGLPATARRAGPVRSETEADPVPQKRSEPSPTDSRTPVVNFNAQRVTALADRPNRGTLSFQLVKDQPDIRFSGYLFVFVEMGDEHDTRIYAYPKRAQLGEGDLPSDYREGESVSFKYNSRVELPYEDARSEASLSRVSILLYGQDGKIVFQRGFDRKEVKTLSAKSTGSGENARNKGTEKRRAL